MSDMVLNTPFYLRFEGINHSFFSNITILDFSNHKSFGPLSHVLDFNKKSLLSCCYEINIFHYLLIQSTIVHSLKPKKKKKKEITHTHSEIR